MKRKLKRIKTQILSFLLILSILFPTTIYGDTTLVDSIGSDNIDITIGEDINQNANTEYYDNIENESTNDTFVYVTQASTFSVVIPKIIILSGEDGIGKYVVKVQGDFAGNETINVIPDKEVTLSQLGKKDIIAPIIQDKTSWLYNEIDTLGNGTITAPLTAGSWNGQFNFNIECNSPKRNAILELSSYEGKIENTNLLTFSIERKTSDGELVVESSDTNVAVATLTTENTTNPITNDGIAMASLDEELSTFALTNEDNTTNNQEKQVVQITPINEGVATINVISKETDLYNKTIATFKVNVGHNYVDGTCTRCGQKNIEDLPAGLYDNNYNLKTSWQTLINNKVVYVNNGVLSTNVVYNDSGTAVDNDSRNTLSGILILPEGITTLTNKSFPNCTNLTKIVLPETLTKINGGAFYNYPYNNYTPKLSAIIVDSKNENFKTVEGILYDINMKTLYQYPVTKTNTTFIVPKSVETINHSAFLMNAYLKEITFQTGLKNIGDTSFEACTKLEKVNMSNTIEKIGGYAFTKTAISSINIPDNIKTIGNCAFSNCTNLTKIYIPSSVITITHRAYANGDNVSIFYNCSTNLKIYCGAKSKPSGWSNYWNCYKAVTSSNANSYRLTTYWGYTREQYNALK